MITYYPDGSWSTEQDGIRPEFTNEEINCMWQELKAKNVKDETIKTIRDLLQFMINTEEINGEEYFNANCDHDCTDCEYVDCCDDCEYSDVCDHDCEYCEHADYCDQYEEDEDEDVEATPTPAAHVYVCKDCEFHVIGFPCSRTTKMKKGCGK